MKQEAGVAEEQRRRGRAHPGMSSPALDGEG